MTYGATLQRTAEQEAEQPIYFLLSSEVDWSEKRSTRSEGIALKPSEPTFRLLEFVSAISIAYPKVIPVWQQPGLSVVHASALELRLVEQRYTFRRRTEVIGFIKAYPFLIPLLLEAYDKIVQHFGPSPVFLEVVTDPEAICDRQLVAFIRTDLAPIEALASLDRFDKSWWLEASHRSQGKLCIHLE
jgi:hypothetical protein